MDRRSFLKNAGLTAAALAAIQGFEPWRRSGVLLAEENGQEEENKNWANPNLGAKVRFSSYAEDPQIPPGFLTLEGIVLGDDPGAEALQLQLGWETETETAGAWMEIAFPEARAVRELWIFAKPLPHDNVVNGYVPYMRSEVIATPRKITCSFGEGPSFHAELRQARFFQILTLPQVVKTKTIRIEVEEIWNEPATQGTGLGKVRVYSRAHAPAFSITAYTMYDVHDDKPVQSATLEFINPGEEVANARLQISQGGSVLMSVPLEPIPASARVKQDIWIPAPFEDTSMEFKILGAGSPFQSARNLRVPAYRKSYFEGGTFNLLCTNHNDLGFVDTQAKTADYRSREIILPAMALLKKYPEFRYSMEHTAFLQEFLERHPEKRDEIAQYMRERRFTWGASYVGMQEAHVGPEKLARQFYLGRRWLRKEFPGVDTHFYVKSDPEQLTWQMPQVLARSGVKYLVQGRFPWGFYNWEAPDGSTVFTYGYYYGNTEMNAKINQGWLQFAADRESYYGPRGLPKMLAEDYTSDYLPPQPELLPYAREQNEAMKRFAQKWNEHFAGQPQRQIDPPCIAFAEVEGFLDEFTKQAANFQALKGDWPFSWTYYDEPSHREGLLAGREGHNRLLAAERFYAPLTHFVGFGVYPDKEFAAGWQANCWPDHGWGGTHGIVTDAVYVASYQKSKDIADRLLGEVGARAAALVPRKSGAQLPLMVFNPVSWKRTDAVKSRFKMPSGWQSFILRDDAGEEVPCQVTGPVDDWSVEIVFLAEDVPSVGYKTYTLEASPKPLPEDKHLTGDTMENDALRVTMGDGGIKSLYDKRLNREILRTDKFAGGEVLEFGAPGFPLGGKSIVTAEDFDQTGNHRFPVTSFTEGPVRTSVTREATFRHFVLKEHFHLYRAMDRVEIDLEVVNWDGEHARELRVAFPVDLEDAQISYEVPFGTVEMGKDELDFSLLHSDPKSWFAPSYNGAEHPLTFREAINWIDASARGYGSFGCLAASDSSVHLFKDESPYPVSYPVLQHVLFSTRQSLANTPYYWLEQPGNHSYRMALHPHQGNWRLRYRDAIAFNFPLVAFVAPEGAASGAPSLPAIASFLNLAPANLILTAMKKAEDDDGIVVRFYEAEGSEAHATLNLFSPIKQAWKTNLIEDEEQALTPREDGSIEFAVKPWEIVTLKLMLGKAR